MDSRRIGVRYRSVSAALTVGIALALLPWAPALADESQWSQNGISTPPSARQGATMIYDPGGQRMILFGGTSSNSDGTGVVYYNDVWILNLALGVWVFPSPQPSGQVPSARTGHTAIYDPGRPGVSPRMLVFGGYNSDNRIYALSLTGTMAWTMIGPNDGPYKADHVAVYDSQHDQMIVTGGRITYGDPSSTKALNLQNLTWSTLPASPTLLDRSAGVYDPINQRVIVAGGVDYTGGSCPDGGTVFSVKRVLSLSWPGGNPTWTQLANGPWSNRAKHSMVFDTIRNRVMLYGGSNIYDYCWCGGLICGQTLVDVEAPQSDIWAMDVVTGNWSQLQPTGGPPAGRGYQSAAYGPNVDQMIIFGGGDNQESQPDCVSQCVGSPIRSFRNDKWIFRPVF